MSSNEQLILTKNQISEKSMAEKMSQNYLQQGIEYIFQAVHFMAQTDKTTAARMIGVNATQIEHISRLTPEQIRNGAAKIQSISLPIPSDTGLEIFFGNGSNRMILLGRMQQFDSLIEEDMIITG